MDIKDRVTKLIKKYHTDNPIELAKALNIHIRYDDLGGAKYGNYMKYKRVKMIIIDKDRTPPELFNFVAAHELGHAICTPDDNTQWLNRYTMTGTVSKVERIAHQFAVELLLNDKYLRNNEDYDIYTLAQCRGVPKDFIQLKSF